MKVVPLKIREEQKNELLDYLEESEREGIITIKWDVLNLEISYNNNDLNKYWPDIEDVKKHTPDFRFYETFGYSINKFSEFLIIAEDGQYAPNTRIITSNEIEITIGELTPMGEYILDGFRENNYHPGFEDCKSIRIYGSELQDVELYLLNGLNYLINKLKYSFSIVSLDLIDEDWEEENNEEENNEEEIIEKNIIPNLELIPNRLFYKGLLEKNKSNAFLDFYRILEYYSVIIEENNVDRLRNDANISKRKFVLEMKKVMNDNERAALAKLVKQVSDINLLKRCKKVGLIDNEKPETLSNNLYDFRNSIVHSKLNQKFLPHTNSIFEKKSKLENWMIICKEIADRVMRKI